jgi:hypothetical protein
MKVVSDQNDCAITKMHTNILAHYMEQLQISKLYSVNSTSCYTFHHHHQPINLPTGEAQAFLMDYT